MKTLKNQIRAFNLATILVAAIALVTTLANNPYPSISLLLAVIVTGAIILINRAALTALTSKVNGGHIATTLEHVAGSNLNQYDSVSIILKDLTILRINTNHTLCSSSTNIEVVFLNENLDNRLLNLNYTCRTMSEALTFVKDFTKLQGIK